ncbi:(d)CMP kinase [Streptacidiphilus sp. P02-A3a]|uniref:(d)CMP kinase n=1 Tax=Streptacidiphilus sp. P02-A3a TaxID=2704468 RepID=UPI0015FD13CC|nr:(d)CMP kinase [Streptacidiphilus sp. P02-A3a]QMU71861.1 (d)CMP kinase [Streptacidiphilus sp. P02-A3a]
METADRSDAPVIVVLDGPAGTGKSTVSREIAARLGLSFLDTGAMYRAMTYWLLQNGVDVDDAEAVALASAKPVVRSGTDAAGPTITVDGVDVSGPIRGTEVTSAVSAVSAVPEVRARMVELQRHSAEEAPVGIVAEGRDLGTVVFPGAVLKVFLTASAGIRATRRAAQLGVTEPTGVAEILADIERRDAADSGRAASPLAKAADAVEVDTTLMTPEEVITRIIGLVRERAAVPAS